MMKRITILMMIVIFLSFSFILVCCNNGTTNNVDMGEGNGSGGENGIDGENVKVNWRDELTPYFVSGMRWAAWINGIGFDLKNLTFVTDSLGNSYVNTTAYNSDHTSLLQYSFVLVSKDDKPSGQTSYFTIKQEGGTVEIEVSYSISGNNLYIYSGLNTYPVYFPAGTYLKN